jgi:uncharacterized protein (TIGR03000 family)
MYSVVMAMALGGAMDMPERCRGSCGCSGYCSGCNGGYASCGGCRGCRGSRRCHGCNGGGYCSGGCYGGGYCSGGYYGGCHGCSGGGYWYQPAGPMGEKIPGPKKQKKTTLEENQATIHVSLPPGARLTIDGQPTNQRVLITPPLERGYDYQYVLRAELTREGNPQVMSKTVTFHAGEETRVNFDFTPTSAVQSP